MKHLLKKSFRFSALILGCLCFCSQLALAAPHSSESINKQISQAQALLKTGKFDQAIAILKPLTADLPRHGLLALSKAYHARKNYLEETRILELALSQNDKDYYVQSLLAECYLANHDFEKAADNFSGSIELKNDYLPAHIGLAKTYEAKDQLEDARQTYNDIIHIFGQHKEYLDEICRLYAKEGSVQEGIDACQRATSYDPGLPANHITLGHMLIENEQIERGEMIILKAARQFKKSEEAQLAAAKIKFKHHSWKDSARLYAQATVANPQSDEGFLGWGKSLFQLRKYADAKTPLIRACTINKKYLSELRDAIAELRQKDQSKFANDYESGLARCGG